MARIHHNIGRAKANSAEVAISGSGAFRTTKFVSKLNAFQVSPEKKALRDQIASYVVDKISTDFPMRFTCLPGATWGFEHQLRKEVGEKKSEVRAVFVGFERDVAAINVAQAGMPKTRTNHHKSYADSFRAESVDFSYCATDRSKLVLMDVRDFLKLDPRSFQKAKNQEFLRKFSSWTSGWLDFTAQLTDSLATSLTKIPDFFTKTVREIPFAVTVMEGRESGAAVNTLLKAAEGDRAKVIDFLLNNNPSHTFTTDKVVKYVGEDQEVTMVTVIGTFKIKDELYDPTRLYSKKAHQAEQGRRAKFKALLNLEEDSDFDYTGEGSYSYGGESD